MEDLTIKLNKLPNTFIKILIDDFNNLKHENNDKQAGAELCQAQCSLS